MVSNNQKNDSRAGRLHIGPRRAPGPHDPNGPLAFHLGRRRGQKATVRRIHFINPLRFLPSCSLMLQIASFCRMVNSQGRNCREHERRLSSVRLLSF